jgi:heme exporter protein B
MKQAIILFRKDFKLELSGMQIVPTVAILSLLIILVFGFALGQVLSSSGLAAAILSIAFLFSGLVAVEKCFDNESRSGALDGLRQVTGRTDFIFWGKFAWLMMLLYFIELWSCIVFAMLFDFNLHLYTSYLIIVFTLFNAGFASTGVLFAAVTTPCRGKAFLLAIVLLPLLIVPTTAMVMTLKAVFDGAAAAQFWHWLKLMAAFDILFGALSVLLFEKIVDQVLS